MIEMQLRVPYADTDQMGMVYYANYFVYFERGRTEWLRQKGTTYKDLEAKGMLLPVIECSCKYYAPARYDDLITIKTEISEVGPASIEFKYEIINNGNLLTAGKTKHPLVNKDFRIIRMSEELKQVLRIKNG